MATASQSVKSPIALKVGFARVAILEYSRVPRGTSRASLDKAQRCQRFCSLFSSNLSFAMPTEYYATCSTSGCSTFDNHCDSVIANFNKKWHPHAQRKAYLDAFSPIHFGSLSLGQQAEHSLSNCNACAKMHAELQLAYPGLPSYSAPSNLVQLPQEGVKEATRVVLGELNRSYNDKYGQSFTEAVVKHCGRAEGIEKQQTKQKKKTVSRELQKKFRDSTSKQYACGAALSFLSENESMCGYQRK